MDADYWKGLTAWINRPPSAGELAERERADKRHQERLAESRERIAELNRPYPLYVCLHCYRVTGWLGTWKTQMLDGDFEADSCFECLTHGPLPFSVDWEPVYDPLLDLGWMPDSRDNIKIVQSLRRLSGSKPPLWTRLLQPLAPKPYERRALKEWLRGVSGWPEQPAMGTTDRLQIRLAEKTEVESPDKSGRLVVFRAGWYDWSGGRWQRRKLGRRRGVPYALPSIFPASLPMEQLLAAWDDFKDALAAEDYEAWVQDECYRLLHSERQALEEKKTQDKGDRDKLERGVAELF